MEVRSDDMMLDIMHAEEVVRIASAEAEKEAQKIVKKATIAAEHLRDKSLVKIQDKQEKIVADYDKKIEATLDKEEKNAASMISELHKKIDSKCDSIAKTLLKEILADVGCENE